MQHTLRQLDVVLTLEVSAACVRACIFRVKRKIPVTPWGAKMNLWNLLYIKHVHETPSKHTSNPQPKQRYIDDTSLEQQTVLELWWIASTLSSRSQPLNTASPLKDPRRSTLLRQQVMHPATVRWQNKVLTIELCILKLLISPLQPLTWPTYISHYICSLCAVVSIRRECWKNQSNAKHFCTCCLYTSSSLSSIKSPRETSWKRSIYVLQNIRWAEWSTKSLSESSM